MIINPYSFGAFDPDAAAYFAAITAAGSSMSSANKAAVNAFVVGCKADGIWSAIKASCILCASDDLTGALVPLVGAAPTNNNFVGGDYSRTGGLQGNGTNKFLDSNRAGNADPQNDCHMACWATNAGSGGARRFMGNTATGGAEYSILGGSSGVTNPRSRMKSATLSTLTVAAGTGLIGVSRSSSTAFDFRAWGSQSSISSTSAAPATDDSSVFSYSAASHTDATLSFYSFGEAIDLAALDARLTTLMSAIT